MLFFGLFSFWSCSQEVIIRPPDEGMTTIRVSFPMSRAIGNSDTKESVIDSVRVIMFKSNDAGTEVGSSPILNKVFYASVLDADEIEITATVPAGYLNLYLIGNEDPAMDLDNITGSALAALATKRVDYTSAINGYVSPLFVMYSVFRAVRVDINGAVTHPDPLVITGGGKTKFPIYRTAAKLSITINCNFSNLGWNEISIDSLQIIRMPTLPWLVPKEYTGSGSGSINDYFSSELLLNLNSTSTAPYVRRKILGEAGYPGLTTGGPIPGTFPPVDSAIVFYVPEHIISNANTDNYTYLRLVGSFPYPPPATGTAKLIYNVPLGNGYSAFKSVSDLTNPGRLAADLTITRNMHYFFNLDIRGMGERTDIDVVATVKPWDTLYIDGSNIAPYLNVSTVSVMVNGYSARRIYFWTNQPEVELELQGKVSTSGGANFLVNDIFQTVAGPGVSGVWPSNFHFDSGTGNGYFDLILDPAGSAAVDSRYLVYLKSSRLRREIEINTSYTPPPLWSSYKWVGTFHRANEVGERIIYSGHTGAWTAEVEDPAGTGAFVVLGDRLGVIDPDIYSATPGNPEMFPVNGSQKSVSGTGNILFRVGMTGPHTATSTVPARYARIKLEWSGSTDYIYVRQGEGPDYVMRPGDAGTNVPTTPTVRPAAQKFSPYNLTAETLDAAVLTQSDAATSMAGNRSRFTDYPSQAGAFFQWANGGTGGNDRVRYAWNPNAAGAVSNWDATAASGYWSTLSVTHETCPPGYRRPSDGSISGGEDASSIASSELRQSLFWNPQTGSAANYNNSVRGYYADGFFDRRQIENGLGSTPGTNSTVSRNNAQIAHVGNLFYNPVNHASLFLPAAGYREYFDNGVLYTSGNWGKYWTNSAFTSLNNSWDLTFFPGGMSHDAGGNMRAYSIRCISCVSASGVTLSRGGSATVSVGATVSLTAAVNGTATPPFVYTWQHSPDGTTWTTVETTTANSYVATVTHLGTNHFKIIVNNLCGPDIESSEVTVTGTAARSAGILYRAADGTLQIGTWSMEVNQSNLLYFKFGSVIGVGNYNGSTYYPDGTPWASSGGASAVWYDMTGGTYTLYDNIPYYNTGTDWPAVKNISNPNYHHGANVKAGKGDPCKIVGLTAAQIQSMSPSEIDAYQSGWRLPTKKENVDFVNASPLLYNYDPNTATPGPGGLLYDASYTETLYPFWGQNPLDMSGFQGGWYPLKYPTTGGVHSTDANGFLPAAGYRGGVIDPYDPIGGGGLTNNGQVRLPAHNGFYWSSEAIRYPDNNVNGRGYGYAIGFDDAFAWAPGHTFPAIHNRTLYAFTVRCTRE